ncbi:IclR family transcriptional regulator C-terminal domain-containing protein, partial [Streptomyces sp. NPDC006307]
GFTSGPQLQTLAQPPGRSAEAALQHRLAALRYAVGAAVYVSSYTDGEIHISRFADGPQAPRVYEWVDFRAAAHASAVGKSLLAQLPFEQRMDHLSRHRAARLTSRTITDPRRLFADIDERGPRAPQFDRQEYSTGEVCVAIPLNLGNQADALALSMPASQQHRLEEAAQILSDQSTVVLLSLLLAGDPPVEPTSAPGQQIIVVPPNDVLRQRTEPITLLTRPAPPPLQAAPAPMVEDGHPGTDGAVTPGTQVVAWDDVVAGREEHVVTMEPLGAYAATP